MAAQAFDEAFERVQSLAATFKGKGKGARLKGGRYKINGGRNERRPYEGNGGHRHPSSACGGLRASECLCYEGKSLH